MELCYGARKLGSLLQGYLQDTFIVTITVFVVQHSQHFGQFPFDTKHFKLEFESYKYGIKEIVYAAKDCILFDKIDFYDFRIMGHKFKHVPVITSWQS